MGAIAEGGRRAMDDEDDDGGLGRNWRRGRLAVGEFLKKKKGERDTKGMEEVG